MSQENVDLVTGAYDDFNSGNVPGVLGRLAPDAEWVEPGGGNSPSGTFRGPDEIGNGVFATVSENFDEFTCTVDNADDQGDTVAVAARFKGKNKSGSELDLQADHTWQVSDGKITRFENDVSDEEGWAAGWS